MNAIDDWKRQALKKIASGKYVSSTKLDTLIDEGYITRDEYECVKISQKGMKVMGS